MKKHLQIILSLLAVAAWSFTALVAGGDPAAPALKPDFSKDDQAKVGVIYQQIRKGEASTVGNCEALLKEIDAVLAANRDVPPDSEYTDIILRRLKLPLVQKLYSLDRTSERKAALRAALEAVCNCPRLQGHQMARERPAAEYDYATLLLWDDAGRELLASKETVTAHIQALLKKYSGTSCDKELASAMRVTAGNLAKKAGLKDLEDQMQGAAATDLAAPGVIDYLIASGKAPTFTGELLQLDGKTLKLPEDTKGRVVVIDFWATWCAPCKASMPHFKTVWEKYQDKGVVFIGESGDGKTTGKSLAEIREKISAFTTNNGYLWTHCASGDFSAVGARYGIKAIPHVMVIGRDGKIFKYQARGGEEAAIEGALKQEIK